MMETSEPVGRILIVDDRTENLTALDAVLSPLGSPIDRARSGVDALKWLLTHDNYAVILLDVHLPDIDGYETAALIKVREKTRHIPIVFVTAVNTDSGHVFRGYSAGAVDYISKPFDPDILRSKVAVFVELYRKSEQLKIQAGELHQAEIREAERLQREREAARERRHLTQLARSEANLAQFKATLDSTLDCVLIIEPKRHRIVYANRGASDQLGYNQAELYQMVLQDICSMDNSHNLQIVLDDLKTQKTPSATFEAVHKRRDGGEVPVEVVVQYVVTKDVNYSPDVALLNNGSSHREAGYPAIHLEEPSSHRSGEAQSEKPARADAPGGVAIVESPSPRHRGKSGRFVWVARDVTERKRATAELEAAHAREKRIAEVLQRSFLIAPPPSAFPNLAVATLYEAAWEEAKLGGDFFDAFRMNDDVVALVVGDVAGKGLQAAGRTAEVKYTVRAYLRDCPLPGQCLTRLNRSLVSQWQVDDPQPFVCLSVVICDTSSGRASIASAGCDPPIILRSDGTTELLTIRGLPVGIDNVAVYEACEVRLSPGDVVAMITDGITEARNGVDLFGHEGVMRVLRECASADPPHIAQTLLSSARKFADGRLHDDVCLLIAKYA